MSTAFKILIVFPLFEKDYIQTYFIPSRLRKLDQTNAVVIPSVWPEDCAMACIKSPNCMSFDYGRINMECRLNTQVSSGGLVPTDNLDPFDYYERGNKAPQKTETVCLYKELK